MDLGEIAAAAEGLDPPEPHLRAGVLRGEAALLLDRLLTCCARGRGALEIAIGEGLLELAVGNRAVRRGCSGIGDYARERLGIAPSTAAKMVQLARELRERPLLRAAVWSGEVSARKAQTVLRAATGEDEKIWVERARSGETVRALRAAVDAPPEEDEIWERICLPVSAQARRVVDRALALAGKAVGATAPKWERVEAICAEYLGSHGGEETPDVAGVLREVEDHYLERLKELLEVETRRWAFLEQVDPVAAPEFRSSSDPKILDAELCRLAELRAGWDDVFGRLAMVMRSLGLWREAGFASFAHYCSERLGMGERTVEQRIALERRLHVLPELRRAMRQGRVSYEKARLVAWRAHDGNIAKMIGLAERTTCIALRRKLEAEDERQMCARGEFEVRAPRRVGTLLTAAISAARRVASAWMPAGECLRAIAQHFIDTWESALREPNSIRSRVLARDRWLCQVPGCRRAAVHVHHIRFRSAGGTDEMENLVSLCAVHHLQGVHKGWIRVRGTAPDKLEWELGEQRAPHPGPAK